MSDQDQRKRVALENLFLDPENPRLAFHHHDEELTPERLVEILFERFSLEEIAESFLANGFFSNEPLVCIRKPGKTKAYTVVEGNRRLAALLLLEKGPQYYNLKSKRFQEYHQQFQQLTSEAKTDLLRPHVSVATDRASVAAYVGFRHVTGIKPWPALEKAGYIADLVDRHKLSTRVIAQKIGSKPVYVARHYQAYRLLVQARDDGINVTNIQDQFGVLMRALQTDGVRTFIGLKPVAADDKLKKKPLPSKRMVDFESFAKWVFGTESSPPLFSDSRQLTKFGRILRSKRAVDYLKQYPKPNFEQAYMLSGGETEEVEQAMQVAEFALRDCVAQARSLKDSRFFRGSLHRAADFMSQILSHYPGIRAEFFGETA